MLSNETPPTPLKDQTPDPALFTPTDRLSSVEPSASAEQESSAMDFAGLDLDAFQQTILQFRDTQFYFDVMKQTFLRTRAEMEQQQQQTDDSILESNVSDAQVSFKKSEFSKLKFQYLEQETKEKFLKKVMDIPPMYASAEDVKVFEEKVLLKKEALKSTKNGVQDTKAKILEVVEQIVATHGQLAGEAEPLMNLLKSIQEKEAELARLNAITQSSNKPTLEQLETLTTQQSSTIATLTSQKEFWNENIADMKYKNSGLESELSELKPKRVTAEGYAGEAERMKGLRNPREDVFISWVKKANTFLRKSMNISDIRYTGASSLEVIYDFDGVAYGVCVTISEESETPRVKIDMLPSYTVVPVRDLQDSLNQLFPSTTPLDTLLGHVFTTLATRLKCFTSRSKELDSLRQTQLKDFDGMSKYTITADPNGLDYEITISPAVDPFVSAKDASNNKPKVIVMVRLVNDYSPEPTVGAGVEVIGVSGAPAGVKLGNTKSLTELLERLA